MTAPRPRSWLYFAAAVRALVPAGRAKEALSGSWLGHAVHPILVVVPIGSWTGVTVLDLVGGRDSARASELLIGLGAAAAEPAIATGVHDWAESERSRSEVRRIGLLHGITNSAALALHLGSLAQRRRGRQAAGVRLARTGFGLLIVGDWLRGHVERSAAATPPSQGGARDADEPHGPTTRSPIAHWRHYTAGPVFDNPAHHRIHVPGVG